MVIEKTPVYNSPHKDMIKLSLDRMHYDILCRYVLQPSSLVRMEQLSNLYKLMNMIDPSTYQNDPEKEKRVRFIFKALEARMQEGIDDRDIILSYINGGITFKIDFLDYDRLLLNQQEIKYATDLVTESLNYSFIYEKLDQIQDIIARFKTSDFNTKGPIVQEFKDLIDNLNTEFRHNKVNDSVTDMVFSLAQGMFENTVTNVWNTVRNPSRRLITGMQALNDMLGGGFESGRFYMLLGASGVGKSVALLNIIYQIKKYNANFKTKDPYKRPAIVLLTMENSVIETVTRLFDLVIGDNSLGGMQNYDLKEVLRIMREEGQLVLNESSPIDIIVRYKASRSVSTSYYYTLYDELQDEGYEMICLVEDHIKRIRSAYGNSDLRIELGDIVNESKAFAIEKDIPFISNTHLNREATKLLEDAMAKNNRDAGRMLGKSYMGESLLMAENMDCGFAIAIDFDEFGNRYMTYNLNKMRDLNKGGRTYFAQPFVQGSTIRLVEDFGSIPQYKDSLHTAPEMKTNTIVRTSGASSLLTEVTQLLKGDEEDEENIFKQNTYVMSMDDEVEEPTCPITFFKPLPKSPITFFDPEVKVAN